MGLNGHTSLPGLLSSLSAIAPASGPLSSGNAVRDGPQAVGIRYPAGSWACFTEKTTCKGGQPSDWAGCSGQADLLRVHGMRSNVGPLGSALRRTGQPVHLSAIARPLVNGQVEREPCLSKIVRPGI